MREPGQGMPVTQIRTSKCPFEACRINAALHMMIAGNVPAIIEIYKFIARYPAEGNTGSNH